MVVWVRQGVRVLVFRTVCVHEEPSSLCALQTRVEGDGEGDLRAGSGWEWEAWRHGVEAQTRFP